MNKDYIKNVILFLQENEQYGDDWSKEINFVFGHQDKEQWRVGNNADVIF